VWQTVAGSFAPRLEDEEFDILEKRGRSREKILAEVKDGSFAGLYWDARVFGIRSWKSRRSWIKTGVVQFGMGISVAPVEVERLTLTNKSGYRKARIAEWRHWDTGGATRGVRDAVLCESDGSAEVGVQEARPEVMMKLVPHAYSHTASFVRPDVRVRHAWYAEHKSPLGRVRTRR